MPNMSEPADAFRPLKDPNFDGLERTLVEDEVIQKAIEESTGKLTLLKSPKRPAADAEEEIGKKKPRFPKKLSAFGDSLKYIYYQKVVVTHLKVGRAEVQYARGFAHRIELKASPLTEIYLDAKTTVEIPKVSLIDIPKFLHKKISFEGYAGQQVSKMGPHFCTTYTDKKFAVEFRSKKEFEADLFDYMKPLSLSLPTKACSKLNISEPFDEFDLKSLKR
ncbi:hypothetical protein L596_020950 [Steinernema carpocapsae]|uniref:Uncharacterized protein n=1 Tax=Steinernema carpocapsae TaxID=34508 RepID=A0A4V6XW07_STECR|nr:hypothetical protein L596_020950 [Steinernema carpocapsae]